MAGAISTGESGGEAVSLRATPEPSEMGAPAPQTPRGSIPYSVEAANSHYMIANGVPGTTHEANVDSFMEPGHRPHSAMWFQFTYVADQPGRESEGDIVITTVR